MSRLDATVGATRLRLTEIFFSLQGESTRVGLPTVFIRLTGCPLRCSWCDTTYSFTGGEWHTIDEILAITATHGTHTVCVTGGEPLAQKPCLTLLTALCEAGYSVSLETSGALDISQVDPRVSRIMDLKAPGSGEAARNHWPNIAQLRSDDEVKIVLADEADYLWAREQIATHALDRRCTVLLSPVQGTLRPDQLAEWVLRDRLAVRMQVQLHKVIWGNQPGR
ncbi:7-carboxy-7-deazaguanine synthase QueE [Niveibacterium sp. 24ML]|uniref:7-carboxy-7-deazaguanine synthase QueE n=1 Tax=Niveibacterium sp. 24ML TaxID=2985512 RepID=UPI00226DA7A3|nr:7-carboxy-7-deazaguanine synthase QueE [Niveibacterium sp. 24ML]MCX9154760.1 7-carboxy-7-deazaguanine synthase QueE [Niveibacterium sp. 24ML]